MEAARPAQVEPTWSSTSGDDLGTMHSDVVKLRQCLFNLLSNAAKFTENGHDHAARPSRGRRPDGDWIIFAVRDTGIGMTAEQLARLFQRFTQADETTTRKFGGTGLGLGAQPGIRRLLGGDITVESARVKAPASPCVCPARVARSASRSRKLAESDAGVAREGRPGPGHRRRGVATRPDDPLSPAARF